MWLIPRNVNNLVIVVHQKGKVLKTEESVACLVKGLKELSDSYQFSWMSLLMIWLWRYYKRFNIVSPLEVDIKNLKDSNKKLLKEIESLHNMNTELRQKVSRLEEKLDAKDKDLLALRNKNAELDKKLNDQEQHSRRNTLQVQGLPISRMRTYQ